MLTPLYCLATAMALMPTDGPVVRVTAALVTPTLEVGQEHEIVVRLEISEGWSASEAGVPNAILQIDAPASIDLVGKKYTTYDQLKRNELLEEPWERLMEGKEQRIRFTLLEPPAEGQTIGLNVVAYLAERRADDEEGELVFIRRRVELPLSPGSSAESATESRRSSWGVNGTLQIGDKAEPFELPRADGTKFALAERLGKSPLIVMTYRAYW